MPDMMDMIVPTMSNVSANVKGPIISMTNIVAPATTKIAPMMLMLKHTSSSLYFESVLNHHHKKASKKRTE